MRLHLWATGPDRKGDYEVVVSPSPSGQSGFKISVDGRTWPALAPMVAELEAAARTPGVRNR